VPEMGHWKPQLVAVQCGACGANDKKSLIGKTMAID
jgi:hypothetical protein